MEGSKGEAGSPLATAEEIQRRLIRPPSRRFPPRAPLLSPLWFSTQNDAKIREDLEAKDEAKTREMENRKLEDYLDPALLSVASSKLGRRKNEVKMKIKKQKRETEKFQWPVDQLKALVADSRMVKTTDWSSDEVIDLKDDKGID